MAPKKKSTEKKKGPKGKKARAKAKLERQWGEEAADGDKRITKRVGNSRLLGKQASKPVRLGGKTTNIIAGASEKERKTSKESSKTIQIRRHSPNDGVSSSDESSDDDSENESAAVNTLLSTIRKSSMKKSKAGKRKNIEHMTEENESGDKMEENKSENESHSEEEGDDESVEDDTEIAEEINDDDDASVQADGDKTTIDFFRQRFSRQPQTVPKLTADAPAVKRIPTGVPFELLVSDNGNELDDLLVTEKDPTKCSEHWQKCAQTAFEGSRKVLQQQWKTFNKNKKGLTSIQAPIYAALARYADVFVTADSMKNRDEMHRLYMMHLLNHVLTARSRIQRHNRQLKDIEKEEEKEEDGAMKDDNNDDGRFRDQGFTRPTVLVLLPNKAACYHFVQNLFKLTGNEMDNGKNERFEAEYGDAADDDESSSDKQAERRKAVLEKKGKEWNELFGDTVNQDDDFKLGIQLTPKAAKAKPTAAKGTTETKKSSNVGIKVYSDFFKSDIILASPLGLKLLIAPDDEEEEGDYDYLSSIEICLVQYSDVLLMQNWDHVNDILALLNQEPQKNHNTDFSRVRNYLLEGQGDRWRQLIISSKLTDPFLSSAFKRFGKSLTGNVRMRWQIDAENASIANVLTPIKQVFQKVPVSSFDKQSECRVNYFVNSILPQILQQKHTMVYVPSYFDFCALRNVLLKREIPFVSVHEYSRTSEVTRGRARFLQGRKPLMLYTGRCNFFHRHSIKGARHLIFLGLPEHAEFYSDHVNQIETTRDDFDMEAATSVSSCLVLCTRFEALALERIVGSTNCARMLKSQKSTFMFYS